MKKRLSIVLVLLLLLTACQAMPDDDQSLASTPTSSGSITPPPSSSVVPTTQPTVPPTTQPETNPNLPAVPTDFDIDDGTAFVTWPFPNVELMPNWVPPAECLVDHLYWVVESTKECILICDEPIYSRSYVKTDTHIFFVKESEPTKVYVTAIGDFSNHQLFYESPYGNITNIVHKANRESEIKNYLQLVADEKRFVMLNMITGKSSVIFEMYKIAFASTTDPDAKWITFEGKPTDDGSGALGLYDYNRITGELIIDDSL